MARLDGEKKSTAPLIVGVVVLAALIAGGYYAMANRNQPPKTGPAPTVATPGDNSAANESAGNSATEANGAADNSATDTNSAITNSADGNVATDSNSAIDANPNAAADNSAAEAMNSADGAAANAAADQSAMGNSASPDATASPNVTPVAATGKGVPDETVTATSNKPGAIIAREKTITSGNATVTYRKEMAADGTEKRSVTTTKTPSP